MKQEKGVGIILRNYKTITSLLITKLHLRHCYVFTKPFLFFLDPQDDLPQACLQLDWHCGLYSAQWNVGKDVGHGQALPLNLFYSSPSPIFPLFDDLGGQVRKLAVTKVKGAGLSGPEPHHLPWALMWQL